MTNAALADVPATPVDRTARIDSLDILRGIGVFGILLMNISAFGLVWQAYGNPLAAGGATGLNLRLFEIMNVGFEGTMRGIFSMLFGAGIVLLTSRMERAGTGLGAADIYFRRMAWLGVFGFIHWSLLLWPGEILFAYAICGFGLFVLRGLPARWQFGIGIAMLTLAAAKMGLGYYGTLEHSQAAAEAQAIVAGGGTLGDEQREALESWQETRSEHIPTAETNAMFNDWHGGSYINAVRGQLPFSFGFQWVNAPFALAFDIAPFMLIGMALMKWGVLSAGRSTRFYAAVMAMGYTIGIPLGIYELALLQAGEYGPVASAAAGRTYQASRLAMVFGHLGLVMCVVRLGVLRRLQRGFAAAGQMALTNYIAQTLICITLFYDFGFGLYGRFERYQLYLIVLAIAAVQMAWSLVWLRHFRFGPLEWVWRSLSYLRRQPMARGQALAGAPVRAT
ncbi:DUF418 domain-containing protein [Croceicoccus marinus]|jgi:uncharacterized protein|uniref:DUF418 domain-containing protein n=1 Tax=Croceicoccus marinus TaxID=450378 RepID=A0A7G6VXE9_9SPHN|nr:DUF418 domain-containing protein [Croceicoccus marinus]QNE06414.1 DUF418 domain-containing protein [Croceicoccus marinus]